MNDNGNDNNGMCEKSNRKFEIFSDREWASESLSVFAYLIGVFCFCFCSINDTQNETIELKCINTYSIRAHCTLYSAHCIRIHCANSLEQDIKRKRC